MFQPPSGPVLGRIGPSGAAQHPGSGSGDSSNNLFTAGERGVWTYVHSLEEKVRQLSEKVQTMEGNEKAHTEKIGQLSDEVYTLRTELNAQKQLYQSAISGHP